MDIRQKISHMAQFELLGVMQSIENAITELKLGGNKQLVDDLEASLKTLEDLIDKIQDIEKESYAAD